MRFGASVRRTSAFQSSASAARVSAACFKAASRAETIGCCTPALEAGITFFDTADMYTQGESEALGRAKHWQGSANEWLSPRSSAMCCPMQKHLVQRIKPLLRPIVARLRVRAGHVSIRLRGAGPSKTSRRRTSVAPSRPACAARTDYIDIYQLHDPPVDVLVRGDFVEALERLRDDGKIRFWGVAGQRPEHALAALQSPRIDSVQVGLSALEQAALDEAIPRGAEHGSRHHRPTAVCQRIVDAADR